MGRNWEPIVVMFCRAAWCYTPKLDVLVVAAETRPLLCGRDCVFYIASIFAFMSFIPLAIGLFALTSLPTRLMSISAESAVMASYFYFTTAAKRETPAAGWFEKILPAPEPRGTTPVLLETELR